MLSPGRISSEPRSGADVGTSAMLAGAPGRDSGDMSPAWRRAYRQKPAETKGNWAGDRGTSWTSGKSGRFCEDFQLWIVSLESWLSHLPPMCFQPNANSAFTSVNGRNDTCLLEQLL